MIGLRQKTGDTPVVNVNGLICNIKFVINMKMNFRMNVLNQTVRLAVILFPGKAGKNEIISYVRLFVFIFLGGFVFMVCP